MCKLQATQYSSLSIAASIALDESLLRAGEVVVLEVGSARAVRVVLAQLREVWVLRCASRFRAGRVQEAETGARGSGLAWGTYTAGPFEDYRPSGRCWMVSVEVKAEGGVS